MSVIQGETVDWMPWVPRIDLWFNAQEIRETMPEQFEGMSVEDIHRSLGWPKVIRRPKLGCGGSTPAARLMASSGRLTRSA